MSNDFYFEEHKPNRGGKGWFYTAIILISLIVGGLFVQFVMPSIIDDGGRTSLSGNAQPTAEVTATPQPQLAADESTMPTQAPDERPDTVPDLGGKISMIANGNISEIIKTVGPAVVGVSNKVALSNGTDEQEQGYGSGVIISEDGYIVTNYHVIEGASSVSVILSNGIELDAVVVGADEYTDLAVLKIDTDEDLTVMPFGDSDAAEVGDLAIAIGNPLGREYAGSVTAGIISGKDRQITVDGRTITMLQTDAAINPGNSGGALLNSNGELIGINSVKSTYTSTGISVEGLGFAIPINSAKPIIEELITEGHIKRPMIGVRGAEVSAAVSEYYNIPQGFLVKEIVEGGPAEKAGMAINDIIVSVDGERTETMDEMSSIIYNHQVGDTITVTVWREGNEIDLKLTLGES